MFIRSAGLMTRTGMGQTVKTTINALMRSNKDSERKLAKLFLRSKSLRMRSRLAKTESSFTDVVVDVFDFVVDDENIQNIENNRKITLFALDFDGVICDSVSESSLSAWKHSEQLWPELFNAARAREEKTSVIERLRAVRPVVETGYENTLLCRALLERVEGYTVQEILRNWPEMSEKLMERWQLDRNEMVREFGRIRDDWIKSDFEGWLEPNELYEDVPEALKFLAEKRLNEAKVTIVTTKQARFANAILDKMGDVHILEEDLISTTVSGEPKADVLYRLEKKFNASGEKRMIFVEDKLSTLIKVANDKRLTKWELFFVDWGYNTEDERQVAKHDYRMTLIKKDEFCKLLKEG